MGLSLTCQGGSTRGGSAWANGAWLGLWTGALLPATEGTRDLEASEADKGQLQVALRAAKGQVQSLLPCGGTCSRPEQAPAAQTVHQSVQCCWLQME